MKKIRIVISFVMLFFACKKEQKNEESKTPEISTLEVTDALLESAVIYEANIRQYSKEGTFKAFTKDIPEIKKLGVDIIWLMPIFPISETRRKATGGDFASKIEDEEERKKMLGSYYAVSDYTKVNPEFGNLEDFRALVKTAHANNIHIILDWVPNHTGWDHVWIKQHPKYYTQNEKGEIIDPINPETGESWGWADVADLNYDNQEMRKEMIEDMKYWITKEGVSGFRCDVAGAVPIDFWQQAIPQLRAEKKLFMLAEAWEPFLLKKNLFDMAYAWEGHHIMNKIAKGEETAHDWEVYLAKMKTEYEPDDILMNFITNHDENSWNGTINERMGDAAEVFLTLSYLTPGMPLIYSGQEYDLNHRLKFFEKDEIPHTKGKMWSILEKLGKLKQTNTALHGGKNAAACTITTATNKNILVLTREKEGKKITFIANLSAETQTYNNELNGEFLDYNSGESVTLKTEKMKLKPWEYKLLLY